MAAKTKTNGTFTNPETGKRLFPEMKKSEMTAIDRKIHALLTAEGYAVIDTQRIGRSGFQKDLNVNQLEYLRGRRERVYVTTHVPVRGAGNDKNAQG
jgi:hypothetical protein